MRSIIYFLLTISICQSDPRIKRMRHYRHMKEGEESPAGQQAPPGPDVHEAHEGHETHPENLREQRDDTATSLPIFRPQPPNEGAGPEFRQEEQTEAPEVPTEHVEPPQTEEPSPSPEEETQPDEEPATEPGGDTAAPPPDEPEPAKEEWMVAQYPPDTYMESFNFLDGDSFGIGPLYEFVYGWQSIVKTMSMKNNVEIRKRAGLQRFALAGINGITIITHIGVTEIMMNGTRTFCFGGIVRPPGRASVLCRGAMYQENRFTCKMPYLRFYTPRGYFYCIGRFPAISFDAIFEVTYCIHGEAIPRFHYDYMCERRDIKIKRVNLTDPNECFNVRNPIVRRAEYYRGPHDILKSCPDWYGCTYRISPETLDQVIPADLMGANDTAFISHGGQYWLGLYYTQLSTYANYFQRCADYPWQFKRPWMSMNKGGIWEKLLAANIGPDMNLHYNLNGIFNRYPNSIVAPDLMRNDGEVLPSNFRTDSRDTRKEQSLLADIP